MLSLTRVTFIGNNNYYNIRAMTKAATRCNRERDAINFPKNPKKK